MAPQYTRASPRRSPRTPKTPVKLTGSSLHSEANFFLLRPRKIRITKNVRLQNEALERAIEAELRSEKLAIEETTLNAHIIFPNRRPRITKAEQAAQDQPTFESLKVGEPAMSDASGHVTCKRGTHEVQSKEPTESDTSGHVQASANNLKASIPTVDRPALEMYLARSTTSHTQFQANKCALKHIKKQVCLYSEKTELVQPSDSAYTHEYRSHIEISHEKHSSDSSRGIQEDGRFLAELKRQLRAKLKEGLLSQEILEAELEAELEAALEDNSDTEDCSQQIETHGGADIPRAHPEHNPVEDESESWGDYENKDDFWKQFKEEDKSEDELSEPPIKAYQKTPKAITPKGHGKAPKSPVRRRGHFLARNSHKSMPSNVQVESQQYAPSTSGPSVHSSGYWESEAFNAGRHERKPPSRHLSPPNPRAVPSDLRISDPEQDFALPRTKVQEQKHRRLVFGTPSSHFLPLPQHRHHTPLGPKHATSSFQALANQAPPRFRPQDHSYQRARNVQEINVPGVNF
ncbi:uncharacterized protein RCO7_09490 [Rhynchosporium graminicola]|uniref:Uncharacterized protein n=1 Tax=Rhynchosporium graminicola TaxID=2792576 RepID=A0A1E1K6B6_9HELO|nr:uncharacterized protein RCO7_09490 [Rhynchosporium commune]